MTAAKTTTPTEVSRQEAQLAKLREPFDDNQINMLPKQMRKDDQDKGRCEPGSKFSGDGKFCGGWHAKSIHLDYVGHAALTARLLDADPEWFWEPLAHSDMGLPVFDGFGGLWIRLHIAGVTRLGYGDSQGKSGGNAVKEAIGDALRNAGMRFGAALDLWHKGDLYEVKAEQGTEEAPAAPAARATRKPAATPAQKPIPTVVGSENWVELADGCTSFAQLEALYHVCENKGELGLIDPVKHMPVGQYLWNKRAKFTASVVATPAPVDADGYPADEPSMALGDDDTPPLDWPTAPVGD
jgi:hypothetical protein